MFNKVNIFLEDVYTEFESIITEEKSRESYIQMANEYKSVKNKFASICYGVFLLLVGVPILMAYIPYSFAWWHYLLAILTILVILGNCSDYEKRQYRKSVVCSIIYDSYKEWVNMDRNERFHTIKGIVNTIKANDKWFS